MEKRDQIQKPEKKPRKPKLKKIMPDIIDSLNNWIQESKGAEGVSDDDRQVLVECRDKLIESQVKKLQNITQSIR